MYSNKIRNYELVCAFLHSHHFLSVIVFSLFKFESNLTGSVGIIFKILEFSLEFVFSNKLLCMVLLVLLGKFSILSLICTNWFPLFGFCAKIPYHVMRGAEKYLNFSFFDLVGYKEILHVQMLGAPAAGCLPVFC